jgi:hypothetical protein
MYISTSKRNYHFQLNLDSHDIFPISKKSYRQIFSKKKWIKRRHKILHKRLFDKKVLNILKGITDGFKRSFTSKKNRIYNTILRQNRQKTSKVAPKKRDIWPFSRYFIGKTSNKLNVYYKFISFSVGPYNHLKPKEHGVTQPLGLVTGDQIKFLSLFWLIPSHILILNTKIGQYQPISC